MKGAVDERIDALLPEVRSLTDRYRARCLWFLDEGYYPQTRGEILRVLGYLERHGDAEAFRAAASIRQCLSQPSSDTSAGS